MTQQRRLRILGLDPAAAGATGYGVVESDGRTSRALTFGAMKPRRTAQSALRLREIHARVAELIEQHAPDVVALESVFSALNVRTALLLSEVRGVILLAAAERNIPVHSYSPREVKSSVAGYGHASKEQVQQMVRAELHLAEAPQPADASDALAVALCHVHLSEANARIAAALGPNVVLPAQATRRRSPLRAARIRA
ncbi:MAG TPA: crossover junction endodeoxyribonuclease RuvC [bacterium]